ncbi:hypothetical protein SELMODRAFT_172930 [Selaginella moellendorffii]|uniref:Uncharacterized protein n=1 Tax=Selaginella moellendorffii TaxID=88036 RepID=D8RNC0_SELML|nr:hypothetical protein SELMODRAFT_172930 [Selaginella moellendorffii]
MTSLLLYLACVLPALVQIAAASPWDSSKLKAQPIGRVKGPSGLSFHDGPILVGQNNTISIYVTFYGNFTKAQRRTIRSFLRSFQPPASPTVARWWEITKSYVNRKGATVGRLVRRGREVRDKSYSMGKELNLTQIETMILRLLGHFPTDPQGIYLLLLADDVKVKGLCKQFCGQHSFVVPQSATDRKGLAYAWIANTEKRCPATCSWPFGSSKPKPQVKGLVPPNGDVGIDGMIVNIAEMLSSVATNPFLNGYYSLQGKNVMSEAVGFCKDRKALPDDLLRNKTTGASFNVFGYRKRQFLVPKMYNPATRRCDSQA